MNPKPKREWRNCGRCAGTGSLSYGVAMDCPVCNGKGRVLRPVRCATTRWSTGSTGRSMHPDFPAKWEGKTWNVDRTWNWVKHQWTGGVTLTPDEMGPFYESIKTKGEVHPGLLGEASIGRKADRALQLLRQAGLIEYSGKPKSWRPKPSPSPSVEEDPPTGPQGRMT